MVALELSKENRQALQPGFSALYDMSYRISTYDFFVWLVHVRELGANEIIISTENLRSKKWPIAETLQRLENYILPGPALAGLPCGLGRQGKDVGSYSMAALAMLAGRSFRRLKSVLPPRNERFTVTMRQTFHNTQKNSDDQIWRTFAREIGARVIEDHSIEPIGLHERMALYAGAEMNFGVPNGPMALLTLSDYPMTMMCDPATTAKGFAGHGIAVGEQIPYALRHQRLVWEKASMDNLMREFEAAGLSK